MLTLKIILLGESGCGKSHLFQKFIKPDRLTAQYRCTSGVDYGMRHITITRGTQPEEIKLIIYDPDGAPRYTGIINSYIAKNDIAVILCDISIEPKLEVLTKYINQVKENNSRAIIFLAETCQSEQNSLKLKEFAHSRNLTVLSANDANYFFTSVAQDAVLKLSQAAALRAIRDYRQQRTEEPENPMAKINIDSHSKFGKLLGKVGISTHSKDDKTAAVDQLEQVVGGQAPCDSLQSHLPALNNGRLSFLYHNICQLLPEVKLPLEAHKQQ